MITAIHKSMAAKRDAIKNDDKGFTLIELLVVVLIIGILAAIAIPAFLGQQNQAKDGAAKADLGNAKIALVSYATANNGTYPGATTTSDGTKTAIGAFGFEPSDGVTTIIKSASSTGYCLEATSATATKFYVTASGGVTTTVCT